MSSFHFDIISFCGILNGILLFCCFVQVKNDETIWHKFATIGQKKFQFLKYGSR